MRAVCRDGVFAVVSRPDSPRVRPMPGDGPLAALAMPEGPEDRLCGLDRQAPRAAVRTSSASPLAMARPA